MAKPWTEADRPFPHPFWIRDTEGIVHKVLESIDGFYCLVCGTDEEPAEVEDLLVVAMEEIIDDSGRRRLAEALSEVEKCGPDGCWTW